MPCRINKTSEWTLRLMYELQSNYEDGASFLTLTFNDENLPTNYTINKRDTTLFFKRLRQNLYREFREFAPDIKYYAVGEYGDAQKIYYSYGAEKPHGRPHYHAIVFGLDNFNDKHREIVRKSWTLCEPWFFDIERGRESGMQEVTVDDIRYVAGYCQKKLYGKEGVRVYGTATPPFSVCSNGLGLDFALQNKERLVENGYTFLKNKKIGIPRYFCDKFGVKKSDLIKDRVDELATLNDNESFQKYLIETGLKPTPKQIKSLHEQWREERKAEWVEFEKKQFNQLAKLRGFKI